MTDPSGSAGHGSTAYRGPTGESLGEQPHADVPEPRTEVPYEALEDPLPGAQRVTPPTPRQGDGGPEPVGLVEILAVDADAEDGEDRPDRAPRGGTTRGAVRRADLLAGPLLLLAGLAAGLSLLVVWVHGGVSGLDLVAAGLRDAQAGVATLAGTGSWQPLAVVGGGAVLFVLGVLMYVPARTHRFLGVIALLASLVVAAGVLVPLAAADWDVTHWAVGAWCAAVVGGLGLIGALEALFRRPEVYGRRTAATPPPPRRGRG